MLVHHPSTGGLYIKPELKPFNRHERRRRRRKQFHNGRRAAVLRAITGARLHLFGFDEGEVIRFPSLRESAELTGANVAYVQHATVVLQSENATLLQRVLRGQQSLLAAAREVKQLAELVAAYRNAGPDDRVEFARVITPGRLWDETLAPIL
jgi:hypothetical protein